MSDVQTFDVLSSVKKALGITGDYHDGMLGEYIDEVREYLTDSGVPESVAKSEKSKGVIMRGVSDLWNYGAGGATLSPYFHERAAQLALKYGVNGNE